MLTLKISTTGVVNGFTADEHTIFIPADRVDAHSRVRAGELDKIVADWNNSLTPLDIYLSSSQYESDGETQVIQSEGRLLSVHQGGQQQWFIASHAWVLGPDGRTIERIAP